MVLLSALDVFIIIFMVIGVLVGAYLVGLLMLQIPFLLVPSMKSRMHGLEVFADRMGGTFRRGVFSSPKVFFEFEGFKGEFEIVFAKYNMGTTLEFETPTNFPVDIWKIEPENEYLKNEIGFSDRSIALFDELRLVSVKQSIFTIEFRENRAKIYFRGWLGKNEEQMLLRLAKATRNWHDIVEECLSIESVSEAISNS